MYSALIKLSLFLCLNTLLSGVTTAQETPEDPPPPPPPEETCNVSLDCNTKKWIISSGTCSIGDIPPPSADEIASSCGTKNEKKSKRFKIKNGNHSERPGTKNKKKSKHSKRHEKRPNKSKKNKKPQ